MRNTFSIGEPDVKNYNIINKYYNSGNALTDLNENLVTKILTAEGCENFVNYIEWLGLAKDLNLVILSSLHHYYYNAEEMKSVKTVVNLRELNHIRKIRSFLHSISHLLQERSNFIGCFIDNDKNNGNTLSRIPIINMLYSLMDSRTNNYMSRRNVNLLLEESCFKVIDMTELNGLTYFCAQKARTVDN